MAARPQYVQDLIAQVGLHEQQLDGLQELTKDNVRVAENLKVSLTELRQEIAVINQKLAELTKRIDVWDTRIWSFVVLAIATLLSLASGLVVTVVTLAKK
jgi:hypothetical protein